MAYALPKNDKTYDWTSHAKNKMVYYAVSEGKIKRIIRYPQRIEEGIAPNTVAVMQKADAKKYQEIWVMYQTTKLKMKNENSKIMKLKNELFNKQKIRIISVWRYPGKSPDRNPIPQEILDEIQSILH